METQRSKRQSEVARTRKRERQGHKELAATFGKLAKVIVVLKLANEFIRLLARLGRQDVPDLQERIRHRINDRTADRERHILQETLANGIVPVRRILAQDGLAILDSNNTRQRHTRLGLPRNVTLLRERKLGRTTKTGLGRRGVKVDGLHRKGAVAVMDKTPKRGGLILIGLVMRHKLVRMALVANLGENGIVRRATHLILRKRVLCTFSTRNAIYRNQTKWKTVHRTHFA